MTTAEFGHVKPVNTPMLFELILVTERTTYLNLFDRSGLTRLGLLVHVRPDLFVQMFKTLFAMTSKERVAQNRARCAIAGPVLSLR